MARPDRSKSRGQRLLKKRSSKGIRTGLMRRCNVAVRYDSIRAFLMAYPRPYRIREPLWPDCLGPLCMRGQRHPPGNWTLPPMALVHKDMDRPILSNNVLGLQIATMKQIRRYRQKHLLRHLRAANT